MHYITVGPTPHHAIHDMLNLMMGSTPINIKLEDMSLEDITSILNHSGSSICRPHREVSCIPDMKSLQETR